ncbi:hypothetical protein LDENG_00213640 [Lucifuga dentata]|nr:hypothetical protein LDENG_00213640 [Lucifuga dentata]
MYDLRKPVLVVMDADMVKTILVKECFSYFINCQELALTGDLYDAVNFAEDDDWRQIRHLISPYFSSGHIKELFNIMKHHARKLVDSLSPKVDNDEVISIKDFFGGYSIDVMASSLFSVDMDLISNRSSPFITHASKLFRFPIHLFIFQAFFPFFVPVLKMLGFSFFPKFSTDYFRSLLEKIRAERSKSSHQTWRDFLQLMINSQMTNGLVGKEQNKGLSDHEILSQATMFIFAGYETNATTLMFLAYNLATNPEAMRCLQEEIDSTFPNKADSNPTAPVQYEALMQMEYLDSVVKESLRCTSGTQGQSNCRDQWNHDS